MRRAETGSRVAAFDSIAEESSGLAECLGSRLSESVKPEEIAIFSRTERFSMIEPNQPWIQPGSKDNYRMTTIRPTKIMSRWAGCTVQMV